MILRLNRCTTLRYVVLSFVKHNVKLGCLTWDLKSVGPHLNFPRLTETDLGKDAKTGDSNL